MDAQANPYLSPGQPEPPAAPVAEIPESIWIPRVASGLGTIVVGTLLMLLADVVSQTLRSEVSLPFSTLQQGVSFIYAAAAIWVFVGLMSCRATPIDAKVRGAIRVSLGATILLAALAMMELTHLGFNSKIVWYWWVARPLASSIGFLAFGYYVLRLAKFLGDAALASESRVAIAATIFFGLAPLSFEAYLGI